MSPLTCCSLLVNSGGMTLKQQRGLSACSNTASRLLHTIIIAIGRTKESPGLHSTANSICGILCLLKTEKSPLKYRILMSVGQCKVPMYLPGAPY